MKRTLNTLNSEYMTEYIEYAETRTQATLVGGVKS